MKFTKNLSVKMLLVVEVMDEEARQEVEVHDEQAVQVELKNRVLLLLSESMVQEKNLLKNVLVFS